MVTVGDSAPDFTVPLANGDIEPFTLSDHLDEGPIVLAFFPRAFTSTCTNEMKTFQEDLAAFDEVGASVYGISVDTPFDLNEFREKHGLEFGLLSDDENEVIEAYDVAKETDSIELSSVAKRAVFVVDVKGTITYAWVSEDSSVEPDYEEVEEAAARAVL